MDSTSRVGRTTPGEKPHGRPSRPPSAQEEAQARDVLWAFRCVQAADQGAQGMPQREGARLAESSALTCRMSS